METNITQGIERRPAENGGLGLYCMVCALNLERLAPRVSEEVIHRIIVAHIYSTKHIGNVNEINNQRKNTKKT